MSEVIKLEGNIRTELGSSVTRRLRKQGRLPAVVYSSDAEENAYIDVDMKSFERELEKSSITTKIFEIKTPQKRFRLAISEIDYDPISDRPRHVDFISLSGKKQIKIVVPFKFLNKEKSPGLKRGGFLNIIKRNTQLWCDVENIPASIDIDVSNLRLKEAITSFKVSLPKDTKFVNKRDFMIVNITGRGKKDTDPVAANTGATATTGTGKSAQTTTTAKTASTTTDKPKK
ncbi:MAG: 50S ribosomal protein L25/general stress protein Ctc [Rickettsiales bacterium]|jgi:large subunit ribosomal protein L25|nr:50S ribosomal protein L25/general stress protein Ctc [Rickettsiales bacterium]